MIKNLILRHWLGEFPLPVSYWGISFLLVAFATSSFDLLSVGVEKLGSSITVTAWVLFSHTLFTLVLLAWSYVGTWRAANQFVVSGKSKVWATLAKIAIVVGFFSFTANFNSQTYPILKVFIPYLLGGDPLGSVKTSLLNDGKTLKVEGVFGNGSYNQIKKDIKQHPQIQKLYLNSRGGRFKEVELIAELVMAKKIDTYVEEQCLSFCTVVFLAGTNRFSTPRAVIGFHAPTLKGASQFDDELSGQAKELYQKFHLHPDFIARILATPNTDMWYPSYQELIEYGVVNRMTFGGETSNLSSYINKSKLDLLEMFRKDNYFASYEKKFPGFIEKIVDIVMPLVQSGKTDSEILNAIRAYASQYQMRALAQSTPDIRARFVRLSLKQSLEVSRYGGEACYRLLTSTLDVGKVLPKPLVREELDLGIEALSASFVPPKNYSDKAFERALTKIFNGMTESEIRAIAEPNPKDVSHTCSALVKFYTALDQEHPASKDILAYGMLNK